MKTFVEILYFSNHKCDSIEVFFCLFDSNAFIYYFFSSIIFDNVVGVCIGHKHNHNRTIDLRFVDIRLLNTIFFYIIMVRHAYCIYILRWGRKRLRWHRFRIIWVESMVFCRYKWKKSEIRNCPKILGDNKNWQDENIIFWML